MRLRWIHANHRGLRGACELGVLRLSLEEAVAAVRAPGRREAELLLSRLGQGRLPWLPWIRGEEAAA